MVLRATAVLIVPILLGAFIGMLLRRFVGRRVGGAAAVIACLMLPAAVAAILTIYFPIVGLWDGVTEGLLGGAGLLFAAHRAYADRRNVVLTAGSVVAGFVLLEIGARVVLGSPPAYPVGDGPHFLLANALRTTAPDAQAFRTEGVPGFLARNALQADLARPGELTPPSERPPAPMLTTELVCSIVYGAAYSGILDTSREPTVVFPERFTPRVGASRRVLHIGDSMVYGANVPRQRTFAAELEKLEPSVEHINGGISGMAPDDYLVVLRTWVARHHVDVAVMYLFAGNDLNGLDAPHPCSNWQSILVYADGRAGLRFFSAPTNERRIGLQWLVINSPLPYLGRVMIVKHSAAAAFLGSALASWSARGADTVGPEIQFEHLESILRSARDELAQRQIPIVVVMLPGPTAAGASDPWVENGMLVRAQRLGLTVLDATQPIRDAIARGENPVQEDGTHLNELGHRIMAAWLHERLPTGGP